MVYRSVPKLRALTLLLAGLCLVLAASSCPQSQRTFPQDVSGGPRSRANADAAGRDQAAAEQAAAAARAANPSLNLEGTAKHGEKQADPAAAVTPGVISGSVIRLTQDWPNPFDGKPPVEPFPGVKVEVLQEGSAEPVASMVSDANGNYSFSGLPDGVYTVRVDAAAFKGKVIQPAPGYAYAVLPDGAAGLTFLDSNGFSAGKLAAGQAP